MMSPAAPDEVLNAASKIEYRAMVLVYLELDLDQFTATDAHYFPEEHIVMTRLSEPKNYYGSSEPNGRTTLCAELPCQRGDEIWKMDDNRLGTLVGQDMARAGLPLSRPPVSIFSRRLAQAYPIYLKGYEEPLSRLEEWAANLRGFLSYGRQGLFAHDNTHHALYMAYAAADCLEGVAFNKQKWRSCLEVFATHVVED